MEEEKPQGKRENAKMMYFDDSAGESASLEAGMGNMVYSSGRLKVQSVGFIVVSKFRKKSARSALGGAVRRTAPTRHSFNTRD